MRRISHSSSTPLVSRTLRRTVSPSSSISAAVAPPSLMRKLQCFSDTRAGPRAKPRRPASSISRQALPPGGFLKVEPPVRLLIGWVSSRAAVIASISAAMTAGSAASPCSSASTKIRPSGAPEGLIFVEALLQGEAADPAVIAAEMDAITAAREETQPIRSRTGGSTFKNPPGGKAWRLIDEAGLRGFALGPARVSEKHCNFLINEGGATAAEIEELGETVRRRVRETSGVELEWEIRRIGVPRQGASA